MEKTNPILNEAASWILTDKAVLLPENHLRALFHRLRDAELPDETRAAAVARNTIVAQIAAVSPSQGMIARIPVYGVLNKAYDWCGMCSTTRLLEQLAGAVADASVSAIVLDIDSPGGFVNGSVEFADAVREANQVKPVTAVVRGLCCSGAYWIASQAEKIISRPECEVGNIGVYSVLMDVSKFYEGLGVSFTTVASGQFKGLGADGKVTDDLVADTRRIVTGLYQQFVSAVATGRGIDSTEAQGLADGRAFLGPQAKSLKLIDALASSFTQAINIATGAESAPESETSAMANANKTTGTPPAAVQGSPAPTQGSKSEDKGNDSHKVLDATIESAKTHRAQVRAAMDHCSDSGDADDSTKAKAKTAVSALKATSEEAGRCAKAWLSKIDGDSDGDEKKPDDDDQDKKGQANGGQTAAAFVAAFGDAGAKMYLDGKNFQAAAIEHIAALKESHKAELDKLSAQHKAETDQLKADKAELQKKLSAMPRGNDEVPNSPPAAEKPNAGKTAGGAKLGSTLTPGLAKFAAGIELPSSQKTPQPAK